MTRKYIVALSAALRAAKPTYSGIGENEEGTTAWEQCCLHTARAIKELNPAFNVQRFLRDCGV